MILSDICIHKATKRENNALVIDPPFERGALQPASLDVTLGNHFRGWDYEIGRFSGQRFPTGTWEHTLTGTEEDDVISLRHGAFLLGTTEQTFTIPDDMCAQLSGKSSLARLGLQVHATAGWIDPGFRGQITLEMSNLSTMPITLRAGMYIAQLVFMQMCCAPMHPYGDEELDSHYQDQTGATLSHLDQGN